MQNMQKSAGKKNDIEYAMDMIEHHKAAVDMSRQLLDGSPDQQLKEFAQQVISAQTKEIDWLRGWIKKWAKS